MPPAPDSADTDPERVAATAVRVPPIDQAPTTGRAAALLLVGVVLVALNLRAAVTSFGALLAEATAGVGMSPTLAGVATMLPALSFAAVGIATPWAARRFPPARILVVAMVVLATGQALRAITGSPAIFLICSAAALSGIAVANVLLPALIRHSFPHRIGLVTGVYTMSLVSGTSAAAAATVPIAQFAGSWRVGLGAWAVLAVLAALPWLPAALRSHAAGRQVHTRAPATPASAPGGGSTRVRPARTGLGRAMAVYFGSQALTGYAIMGWMPQLFRDAGFAPAHAGLLLAVIIVAGAPAALVISTLAGRVADLRPVVLSLSTGSVVAYAGLAVAPRSLVLLWVLLLAIGQAAFPFALTLIGLRARTPDGTVALSAFTQGVGYLFAGLGPLLMGVFYELTGAWTVPMAFLILTIGVQTVAGLVVARPRYIEDV